MSVQENIIDGHQFASKSLQEEKVLFSERVFQEHLTFIQNDYGERCLQPRFCSCTRIWENLTNQRSILFSRVLSPQCQG